MRLQQGNPLRTIPGMRIIGRQPDRPVLEKYASVKAGPETMSEELQCELGYLHDSERCACGAFLAASCQKSALVKKQGWYFRPGFPVPMN